MIEARKHISQMLDSEKVLLNSLLVKDNYRIGNHAVKRGAEKIITRQATDRAIHNGSIIEYHYKDGNRVLVRGNIDEGGFNVCCVYDCDHNTVITIYDNEVNDKHFTLNKSLYRKKLDITGMVKKGTRNKNIKLLA